MDAHASSPGFKPLRAAARALRGTMLCAGIFSVVVNALMLTGPLFMLQVYDSVLGSGSVETLVALSGIVGFLYLMMWALDAMRGRIMARAGAQFQVALERPVFDAMIARAVSPSGTGVACGLGDLRAVHGFLASPVATAGFDLPFAPLFLAGVWVFHPALGMLALGGGALLIGIAVANQAITRRATEAAAQANHRADALARQIVAAAETVRGSGMQGAAFHRWSALRASAMEGQMVAGDAGHLLSSLTRAVRLFLQSAMLGLAAYLVLLGQLTPGAMIAASILMGRALAPIEQIVGQWPLFQRARQGWVALDHLQTQNDAGKARTALPTPSARLEVRNLAVIPPGRTAPALQGIAFTLAPGQALGVIGPSGAGKSTLIRAITGLWPPASGQIGFDGAALGQYPPDRLGRHIGYLPQRVQLFEGTIAENIARLSGAPDSADIIAAAKRAGAHAMIAGLPHGYDTPLQADGSPLSGGQIQRIGLARALYGNPVMLVLDEPNSSLDAEGSEAVNNALRSVKEAGGAVVIVAHRPAAIAECDLLLVLEDGRQRSFGPKAEVLGEVLRNHTQIVPAARSMGSA